MKKRITGLFAVCLTAVLMTGCGAADKNESSAELWTASTESESYYGLNDTGVGGSYCGKMPYFL